MQELQDFVESNLPWRCCQIFTQSK